MRLHEIVEFAAIAEPSALALICEETELSFSELWLPSASRPQDFSTPRPLDFSSLQLHFQKLVDDRSLLTFNNYKVNTGRNSPIFIIQAIPGKML